MAIRCASTTTKARGTSGSEKHELRVELTLPNLNEFTSEGVGTTEVSGFTGETITLALDGAGSVKVNSNYKNINSRLGGVGSMTLNAGSSDLVDLNMRGAGSIDINGQSRVLRAKLGGVGSLDAKGLQSDSGRPRHVRPRRRNRVREERSQPAPERPGLGDGLRQPGQPQRDRARPGQRVLEISGVAAQRKKPPFREAAFLFRARYFLIGDVVLDRLDALDVAHQPFCLLDMVRRGDEAAQLHRSLEGFDLDFGGLEFGIGDQRAP